MDNTKLKELYANLQPYEPQTDVGPVTSFFLNNEHSRTYTVQHGVNLGNGIYYIARPNNKYDIYNQNTDDFKAGLDSNTAQRILNTW